MHRSFTSSSKNSFIPFILFVVIFMATILSLPFLTKPVFDKTFLGGLKNKIERVKNTEGKRIIVIGGSSVPFSLDGNLIQENFPDYTFIDFGLYLNIGTTVMCDFVKPYVHEGDIIIIAPEQTSYALSLNFSPEEILEATDNCQNSLLDILKGRSIKIISAIPQYCFKKIKYIFKGSPNPDGIYNVSSFNKYGDVSYNRPYNIMPNLNDSNVTINFDATLIQKEFTEYLNNFARYTVSKGTKVYYHFSPMNSLAINKDATPQSIHQYYNTLQQNLLFTILGNPNHCIMDPKYFYDTNFHLNSSGSIYYTKLFIEDLKTALKDTSVTVIKIPNVPEPPVNYYNGVNLHQDLFLYKETNDGLIITELISDKISEIIIPTSYNGIPVIDYDKNVFKNKNFIKSITFQPNIRLLKDNSFTGCTNLKSIILESKNPSDFSVGEDLFSENNFVIYVPQTAVENYKTHYNFKKYDTYIFGK